MNSHRERIEACLSGVTPDRVPVALWRHYPVDDNTAETQATATLAFQQWFDFDFVKVTPQSSYCLRDWGALDDWQGASEGTYSYLKRVIQKPDDWYQLRVLDPYQGQLNEQLRCLSMIVTRLGEGTPVIQTIFNPLSQAKNLVGGANLLVHLRRYPEALHAGLEIIAQSTQRFVDAARSTGIAGVFFAVQHASYGLLTQEEYDRFGRNYDLKALESLQDMWLNILHLHGNDVMFEKLLDYPVQVINWHDQDTWPSLREAREIYTGVLCGGLSRERAIVYGSPEMVREQARQAIEQTDGRRFILGTGCVVPIIAPYGNLIAARQSVE